MIEAFEREVERILKEICKEEGIEYKYKRIHVGFKDGFRYTQAQDEDGWHTLTKRPVVLEEENEYEFY